VLQALAERLPASSELFCLALSLLTSLLCVSLSGQPGAVISGAGLDGPARDRESIIMKNRNSVALQESQP